MSLTDWQIRKLDEQHPEWGAGPAVGGIMWVTCLAPTAKGPCFHGVPFKIHDKYTGQTRCPQHRGFRGTVRAFRNWLKGLR